MSERDGKTGEYSMFRKGTNTVIATVNLATVGTTRKYIMSGPNDTPRLVNKTPAELRNEPQLKSNLFATLQVRDARLGNKQFKKPDGSLNNQRSKAPDHRPQPPKRMVDNGMTLYGFQPYFEIGGGLNFPSGDRDLDQFSQSINAKLGGAGFGEAGIKWNNVFGNVGVSAGIVGQFQNTNNQKIENNFTQGGPAATLNGTTQTFSIFPRVTLSGPLSEYFSWRAGAGGGVAFQKLDATDLNGGSINGSKATAMVNVNGGLGYMLMPGVDIWLNGYATWLEGFDVETNTNAPSRYNSQWNTGATVSLRFSLQQPSPR